MNRRLLDRLSNGSHADFIDQFVSSRYEFVGIELYRTVERDERVGHVMLASGHQGRVRFDLEDILMAVQEAGANAIAMIHNHPFSPKFEASREDIDATERVHLALQKIGAEVIDHRIYVSDGRCLSFVEEGIGRWGWETVEFQV